MSAATLASAGVGDRDRPPAIGRLTGVELRKMTDTRAGAWLLAASVLLTPLVVLAAVLGLPEAERTDVDLLAIATVPASLLLPVAGILLVTTEWTQGTVTLTFALVPRRGRVLVAKLLGGLALVLGAYLFASVVAFVATVAAGGDGGSAAGWVPATVLGQGLVSVTVPMVCGIAFGTAILASAPAIATYFVLPTACSVLGSLPALRDAARWLDQTRTTAPLLEETLGAAQWAHLAVSVLLWTAVPAAIGAWRVLRRDVG